MRARRIGKRKLITEKVGKRGYEVEKVRQGRDGSRRRTNKD